jgi:hypothetical protein
MGTTLMPYLSPRGLVAATAILALSSCAVAPPQDAMRQDLALNSTNLALNSTKYADPSAGQGGSLSRMSMDRDLEDRILALDPDRISGDDVKNTLALGPTPKIILSHGGVALVYMAMQSFGTFLIGMGYPEERILDPHDGSFSQNPYTSTERIAGQVAWYYENDGVRPMLIGHSQGGMQTVKVLHDLAGDFGDRIPVWNPVTDRAEQRYAIVDPLSGETRPVVGASVSYASVVGTGGLEFWAPTSWSMIGRLRQIPDTVEEFTGFYIRGDPIALTAPTGANNLDAYQKTGRALVRNVNLPASYNHVFVPNTELLAHDAQVRDWINAHGADTQADTSSAPDVPGNNVLWAAVVWHDIKKHWCLEAQRLIQARRSQDESSSTRSAHR